MTNLGLIGAAAAISAVLVGPAMARHVTAQPGPPTQSIYCATREAGNPYSEQYDYMAWSAWRARGSWDSRGDDACLRNPAIHHQQAGF